MNYQAVAYGISQQLPKSERASGDEFIDLERLWSMARRQLKVVALCMAIGLVGGIVYLQTTPKTFVAASRILIDDGIGKSVDELSPLASSMLSEAEILSQIEIIRSARLASVVVEKEKLDQNAGFLSPPRSLLSKVIGQIRGGFTFVRSLLSGAEISVPQAEPADREAAMAAARKEIASLILQSNLIAQRVGRSNVIAIGFQSNDPRLAQSIASAYADAYLADQLDANFEATERATVWLQERLNDLRQEAQAAAMTAEKFRAEHGLSVARGELMSEQRLSDLNSQLIVAQSDTAGARARYEQYRSMLEEDPQRTAENLAISGEQVNNSVIAALKASYLDLSRREQEVSQSYGPDHKQAVALRGELAEMANRIYQELKQIAEGYRNEYAVAQSREDALRSNVEQASGQNSEAQQSQIRLRELEQRSQALNDLYQTFLARYEQAAQQQSFPIAKVRIISDATLPRQASSPRTTMVLGFALVLGAMMGMAFGTLNEFNERFFRTGDDVRSRLGVKFLGYLPVVGTAGTKRRRKPGKSAAADISDPDTYVTAVEVKRGRMTAVVDAPHSAFAETLRSVKIASDVLLQGTKCRVIGVVSALPGEGKSTVAANLAALLAANDLKTLLIDGDLRNPGLTRGLGIIATSGIVEAVIENKPWKSVAKFDKQNRYAIVPAVLTGRLAHTSELLSSQGMRQFLNDAKSTFDYIIVDLPPLGAVVDAKAFAPLADGFLIVIEWGKTPRAIVRSVLESEPAIAEKTLGTVLNKVNFKALTKYGSSGSAERFLDKYASYYVDRPDVKAKAPA